MVRLLTHPPRLCPTTGVDCSLVKDPTGPGSKLYWEIDRPHAVEAPSPAIFIYELPRFVSHGLAWSEGVGGDFGRCLVRHHPLPGG